MSTASLSAAKKRRANIAAEVNTPPISRNVPTNKSTGGNGLTIQQIITTFNSRITKLEENTNNYKNNDDDDDKLPVSTDEIDARFHILVHEIGELKDMVIKLQSFTMQVNKTLFDERIKLLSIDNTSIDINNDTITQDNDLQNTANNIKLQNLVNQTIDELKNTIINSDNDTDNDNDNDNDNDAIIEH